MGNQAARYWETVNYDSEGLEPGIWYYWRIDEVNDANTIKGNVWSFRIDIPELVAWWKFDDGAGTVAFDSEGHNNGQLINGPAWTTGRINGGLDLDGVDDYVGLGDTVRSELDSNYTVTAWIKADTITGLHTVAAYRDTRWGGFPRILFQLEQAYDSVRFIVMDNDAGNVTAAYYNVLTAGSWYHLAGVRAGNTLNVYVNGVSSPPATGTLYDPIDSDTLLIGAYQMNDEPPIYDYFDGVIDDVRVYRVALTAGEIQQLYQEGQN
jgi:hypothetical protein